MKKTTLLLLSTCLLYGCYSAPEMNEVRYSHRMTQNPLGCDSVGSYQNEGLRNCIESRMAYEDANKKTVTIIPTDNGTLVVPKTGDDEDMKDPSRVYEVVEPKSNTQIVIKDESLAEGNAVAQASETQVVVDESVSVDNASAQVSEDVQGQEAATADEPAVTQEVVEVDDATSSDMVEDQGAEYETLSAIDDTETTTQEDEGDTHEETTTTTTTTSPAVEGVTLVVGPLKEDLTISVKTKQNAAKTTTKTRTVKKVKKIEKEVLPLEEK